MRTCAATGRFFHSFDKVSHRCRCGRWKPGFKPKEVDSTTRGECQICEHHQAIGRNGRIVLHGYQRPGHGWLIGKCYGVDAVPFPATDRLQAWASNLEYLIQRTRTNIAETVAAVDLVFTYQVPKVENGTRVRDRLGRLVKDPRKITLHEGDLARYTRESDDTLPISIPSFEDFKRSEISRIENHLRQMQAEETRVLARIVQGKAAVSAAAKAAGS